jgi:hypothetical protein
MNYVFIKYYLFYYKYFLFVFIVNNRAKVVFFLIRTKKQSIFLGKTRLNINLRCCLNKYLAKNYISMQASTCINSSAEVLPPPNKETN